MSTSVRVSNVVKTFRSRTPNLTPAVDRVDLVVERGQALGIIGPNGAGKTTLLRLIAGILQPDSGTIERVTRTVALIDLGTGFHPDLTGDENIDFACALLGLRPRQIAARRESIKEFAGIDSAIYRPVRNYSTGMVARLAFAIAIHTDPELLLVDEVLAVGDDEFQRRCIESLRDLSTQGVTSMMVSHDLSAIAALCDRAILLEDGSIHSDGTPPAVIAHYLGSPLDTSSESLRLSVGVDRRGQPDGSFTLRVSGEALRRHPDARAVVQIGLPVHPAANVVEGLDGPLIIAEAPLIGPWEEIGKIDLSYAVQADGLPPGQFIVRALVETPMEDAVHSTADLVIDGRPPPTPEIVLASSATLTAADVAAR